MIVANAYLPVKNIRELTALAKSRPDEIVFASGGNGSSNHLAFELLKSMADVKMVHVAYKGDAPAMAVTAGMAISSRSLKTLMPYSSPDRVSRRTCRRRHASSLDVSTKL